MQRKVHWQIPVVVALAVLGLRAVGCSQVRDTEQLLGAAGFKMKPADTPQKLAHLRTLTQHKLLRQERDGHAYYVYADATQGKCLYVGDQQAYREYRRLAAKAQVAEEDQISAETMDAAPFDEDWKMWGVW